jgi:hypothetical protein
MVSTWEPRLRARDNASERKVGKIIAALGKKRTIRVVDPNAWRVDMGLDPTDEWATAHQALVQDLRSIDEDWHKLLRIEV